MPIPEWNKQLYLDSHSLPSGADKGTRCYQREIGAEGRKIYISPRPARLSRALEGCADNPVDSGCAGSHGSQLRAALATTTSSSQLLLVFPQFSGMFGASTAPLPPWALWNLNLLTTNPRGTAEVGIIYILTGQLCCCVGILGCLQHHLSPSKLGFSWIWARAPRSVFGQLKWNT